MDKSRRLFLKQTAVVAPVVMAAPAIVTAANMMPLWLPPEPRIEAPSTEIVQASSGYIDSDCAFPVDPTLDVNARSSHYIIGHDPRLFYRRPDDGDVLHRAEGSYVYDGKKWILFDGEKWKKADFIYG